MNIKPLIVRQYLESLTEKNELNKIFPMLLESMKFIILTNPKEYLGLKEYGKDIVAVGRDIDGEKKRFYFELKGGNDRHITEQNFYKKDGIHESIIEASYNKFVSAYPDFEELPLKIVIVHNGEFKGTVRQTYESFILKTQSNLNGISFDRWGISELTNLFSSHLFGAYLLTDSKSTKLFNQVLVNLNATQRVSEDFKLLLNVLLDKNKWVGYNRKLPRKWELLFESLKLIGFIIYTESKEHNNLDISKRYLTHLVLRLWYWILKNKLENDKKIIFYFNQIVFFFYDYVLGEYLKRTASIVTKFKDGLYSDSSGRYEEIGYTQRTFEYLAYLFSIINMEKTCDENYNIQGARNVILQVVNNNNVCTRALIDIHSIPIIETLNLFIETNDLESSKNYLKNVLGNLRIRKKKTNMIPDAANNIESVIRYSVSHVKPVYYIDSTSPLLAVLMEYTALLDLEDEYEKMVDFILENNITLGIFVPHHSINSTSRNLIEDKENDLEEQLFSKSMNDGYQVDTILNDNFNKTRLSFKEFKEKISKRQNEFQYEYRTDKAGFSFLKNLAHWYFKTPYFPDKWRFIEVSN